MATATVYSKISTMQVCFPLGRRHNRHPYKVEVGNALSKTIAAGGLQVTVNETNNFQHIPLSTVASFHDQSECNPYFGSFRILATACPWDFKIVQPPYATGTLFCNGFMQPLLQPLGVFVQPPYATPMQPPTPERKLLFPMPAAQAPRVLGEEPAGQFCQSPKGQQVHPLELSNPKGLNNRYWAA